MLPLRTLLRPFDGIGHDVEVNMVEEQGKITFTFLRDGKELPPLLIIENIGGRTSVYMWEDREMPCDHRVRISRDDTAPRESDSSMQIHSLALSEHLTAELRPDDEESPDEQLVETQAR